MDPDDFEVNEGSNTFITQYQNALKDSQMRDSLAEIMKDNVTQGIKSATKLMNTKLDSIHDNVTL